MKFSLFPSIKISFLIIFVGVMSIFTKVNVDLSDERIQNLQDSCKNFAWYESRLKYKKRYFSCSQEKWNVFKCVRKIFSSVNEHKNWPELKIFQVFFLQKSCKTLNSQKVSSSFCKILASFSIHRSQGSIRLQHSI